MRMRKFTFFSDLGHAWLQVPIKLLEELGIRNKITKYSYRQRNNAYLEEDVDAPLFCKAYKEKYGKRPEIWEVHGDNNSPIRGYDAM